MPLEANIKAKIKLNDINPVRLCLVTDSIVSMMLFPVSPGMIFWIIVSTLCVSSSDIGRYAMNVKNMMIEGKIERKKLNAMELARVVMS